MIYLVGLSSILAQTSIANETISTTDTVSVLKFSMGLLFLIILVTIYFIIKAIKPSKYPASVEGRTITMAAMFLLGLIIVFAQAMAMYYWGGNNSAGQDIFNTCKTLMPPLVTLVVGFYFGQARPQEKPRDSS